MPDNEIYTNPPEWHAEGIEPTQGKKGEGWGVEERPPAPWFNWLFHRIYKSLLEIRDAFVGHRNATSGAHGATHEPKPERMVVRDDEGRARFADPEHDQDAATKGWAEGHSLGSGQQYVFYDSPDRNLGPRYVNETNAPIGVWIRVSFSEAPLPSSLMVSVGQASVFEVLKNVSSGLVRETAFVLVPPGEEYFAEASGNVDLRAWIEFR